MTTSRYFGKAQFIDDLSRNSPPEQANAMVRYMEESKTTREVSVLGGSLSATVGTDGTILEGRIGGAEYRWKVKKAGE